MRYVDVFEFELGEVSKVVLSAYIPSLARAKQVLMLAMMLATMTPWLPRPWILLPTETGWRYCGSAARSGRAPLGGSSPQGITRIWRGKAKD